MKKNMSLSLFICISLAFAVFAQEPGTEMTDSVKDSLINKEKAMWEALKNGNLEMFETNLNDNFVSMYDVGIYNKSQELDNLKRVKLTSYSLSEIDVKQPADNIAILTYTAESEGSYMDEPFSGKYNVISGWLMKDGQWVGIFHSDVMAAPEQKMGMEMQK